MTVSKKTEFTVADYLLTRLKQLDVNHVFQIPGDYVKHFTQALESFDGVRAIGCANELDASYAADGYGRTKGLGAVSLQFGVSTFSALNAIAGAYVERSPVVVISASPSAQDRAVTDMYGVLFHHSIGDLNADQDVYKNVTVDSAMLDNAELAPEIIDRVLTAAITESRPVYLAAFEEIWGYHCKKPDKKFLKPQKVKSDPVFLQNAIDAAWNQISNSQNPLIFAGVEILRFGLENLLTELIDESGFLFTTTSLGKTVIDESHKSFIGTYSDLAATKETLDIVNKSDCFITLGAIITDDYLDFISKDYGNMIRVDTEHSRVGYAPYPNVTTEDFIRGLINRFRAAREYPKSFSHQRYLEPWAASSDIRYDKKPGILTFNRFFEHMMSFVNHRNLLPEIVMNFGVSSSLYVGTNMNGLSKNSFIASAAWQCIGFETGVTAGVALGSGKRSWTIAGDGGFMMVCQSLSTLVKMKEEGKKLNEHIKNPIIFVMSNGVYAIEQVYVNIDAFKPNDADLPKFDTFDILPKWDYVSLAKGFGAKGYRVKTIKDLKDCLKEIIDEEVPCLVEVVIPDKDLPKQMEQLAKSALK